MKQGEKLLSIAEAAKQIGMPGYRGRPLYRLLLTKEKRIGKQIMTRMVSEHRTHCRVTIATLRQWCPELFKGKPDEMTADLKRYVGAIENRIKAVVVEHVSEFVEPQIRELWVRDLQLANDIKKLQKRKRL